MNQSLKYFTLSVCFFAWIFFLVGCIGYANEESTVKNVAWVEYHDDYQDAWYALHKYAYKVGGVRGSESYQNCGGEICDRCESDGKTAFGLLIVALIATTFATVLSHDLLGTPSKQKVMSDAVLCFSAFLASLISIGVFMGGCYDQIVQKVADEDQLSWGPGAVLSIIAMFLVVIAFVILVIDYFGSGVSVA